MEPVVLVDKPHNQEAHIIANLHHTFDDLMETARRINTQLFVGQWDLVYLDANQQAQAIAGSDTVGSYLERNISTFYWAYKPPRFTIPLDNRRPAATAYNPTLPNYRIMQYGNMGKRIGAYIIDYFILFMSLGILSEFIEAIFADDSMIPLVVMWLYFAGMESSRYQASLGKLMLGLRVADLNGNPINFGRASARFVLGMVNMCTATLGYWLAFFTNKHQTLSDILVGTLVLERNPNFNQQHGSNIR